MVTELVVSKKLGDEISQAVRQFAEVRGWSPDHYDLWYHDEPVWIVREKAEDGGTATVRRVQIRPFDTVEGFVLSFTPDAMAYDIDSGRVEARPSPHSRVKGSHSVPIVALELFLSTPRERLIEQRIEEDPRGVVRSVLLKLLALTWSAAGSLTLESATE